MIESISAITLATHDMARAVRFYNHTGFDLILGDEDAALTSFQVGAPKPPSVVRLGRHGSEDGSTRRLASPALASDGSGSV